MAKKTAHSPATPATTALDRAKLPYTTHAYEHDPSAKAQGLGYGEEAALALGVPAEQVFKTLLAQVEGIGLVVGVVPVTAQLDLKALAHAAGGKKATMAQPKDAERSTGYVVGGISPIGQRKALPTIVDVSATEFDKIYVSGGRRGFDIGLAPKDLLTVTSGTATRIASKG